MDTCVKNGGEFSSSHPSAVYWPECDVPVPGTPVPGNSSFFLMVSEPESKKFGTEKSLGTGIEKIWYRKRVSEPVSKNFGTEKSLGTGLEKFWYRKKSRNRSRKNLVPKKSLGIGIVQILGLVTHCIRHIIFHHSSLVYWCLVLHYNIHPKYSLCFFLRVYV